jgi:pimeloyl-ACP methyl ester carboxylesterase
MTTRRWHSFNWSCFVVVALIGSGWVHPVPAAFVPEVRACHTRFRGFNDLTPACRASIDTESIGAVPPEMIDSLDVALFGIGDLRTDDHEGLRKALERAAESETSRILPLIILDKQSIANIPGAIAHTEDTASMIAEAIKGLQMSLADLNLPLHVEVGSESLLSGLSKVMQPYLGNTNVRVHVCDHGVVDNSLKYTPLAHLQEAELPLGWTLRTWKCDLRADPWENLDSLPDTYSEYTRNFQFEPHRPVPVPDESSVGAAAALILTEYTACPRDEDLNSLIQTTLGLDQDKCHEERNSGLYGTHWGGLSALSIGESKVTEVLRVFVDECQERDEEFARLAPRPERNEKSLEHATMIWNLRGDGTKSIPDTNNVIAGELLSRYLLAPLMLGTLSPRRLWWSVKGTRTALFTSPLKTLVETREWHKLFAAKQFMLGGSEGAMKYKYWRWHGFLSRYGEQTVQTGKSSQGKEGILLIHGFGASANQWQKNVGSLSSLCTSDAVGDKTTIECLAPDLIGFGQSEKPPITYSGFTWESYTGDFIKEVAVAKNGWDSFAIGGNSIGGFVAMCAAANDATTDAEAISGCGAPGTGRCTGAILMNAAGVIQSREDVATIEASVRNRSELRSVAQVIACDGLGPCK